MRELLQIVEFFVPGEPVGKGRPRVGKVGQHARLFTPAKTVNYEGLIAHAGSQAMQARALIDGPVLVEMHMGLSIPQSMSKKLKALAVAGRVFPTKKPDMDNVIKAIFDGLNGAVWVDDVQVVDTVVRKRYAETPGVRVRVVPLYTADHQEAV
ncbi:RusA family crossover junction endodeoxyribonuclease [Pseudomonas sp. PDM13]|uniref:RusA family crossover junction endodeoxyribonuclease n=1 Tax=Pseudomonas sp. PDM13 TaxID=2769255 RepID=UPI0021DF41D5|nr:RusA family crossover junction endodeoxyribonuclease [Pseudomonas sp. PDM13]MCU9949838.1 RusA family crossover junction endodeoxyribonuclease [Pseudomonas sp. PDM13]